MITTNLWTLNNDAFTLGNVRWLWGRAAGCPARKAGRFILQDLRQMERKTDQFGNIYWQCVKCRWTSPALPPEQQQETPPPHHCTGRKRDTWF